MRLWYKTPAQNWEDGLPIGNGQVGAMVLGGVPQERILLNHNRLWRQKVNKDYRTPKVGHLLKNVQKLYFEGKYDKAVKASSFLPWSPADLFAPFGDLYISFPGHALENISDYRSELDLATGIAKVGYVHDGVKYFREIFTSRTDDVIVIRLSADKEGSITSGIELSRVDDPECEISGWAEGSRIGFLGKFEEGVCFAAAAEVFPKGGKLFVPDEQAAKLSIEKSNEVLILLSMNAGDDDELIASCRRHLDKFKSEHSFTGLSQRHIAEHKELFGRVELSLGKDLNHNLPTDERVARFAAGEDDPGLVPLQFQFGRYLILSASRPGCLPANLQGIWNGDLHPIWESAYVSDCNLQICYWAAEVTNLSECHDAYFGLIEDALPAARQTAMDLFGCRGIFMGIHFDPNKPARAFYWEWTGAAAWLAQHFWLRWEYTQDKEFLCNRTYPVFKELGMFYEDFLVEDPRPESPHFGKLVTVPAYSPEAILLYKGKPCTTTIGSAMDFELIYHVFTSLIKASEILDVDADKRKDWQYILDNIPPLQIGKYGQLQEWLEDLEEKDHYHRHISHLWGLYPGDQITPEDTPEFAQAARVSLARKMDPRSVMCPWPAVWLWYAASLARLREAEWAYELVSDTLRDPGMAYRNLISKPREGGLAGPVFQIDGNAASPAAIAEMLMQSHNGEIKFLPALPKAWPEGYIKGLVARGAFEIHIEWKYEKLTQAVVKSKKGNACRIKYDVPLKVTSSGKPVVVRRLENSAIEFETEAGKEYIISI